MARMTYEQALADYQYLWSISAAYDMTGGYEDQNDLDKMLRYPTKTQARQCLGDQIRYWFRVGPADDCNGLPNSYEERQQAVEWHLENDPEVSAIRSRH